MSLQESQVFHNAVSKVLFISQIFALLPVSNVLDHNVKDINYNWLSLNTIYTTLILLLNSLEFLTVMNLVLKEGINFVTAGTLSLFVVCLLEQAYFWRLATKWPFIMRTWRETEELFLRAPYQLFVTFNMKRRIYILTAFINLGAFVEHLVLVYNSIHHTSSDRKECNWNISLGEIIYKRDRYYLYLVLPYHVWMLPILEWINLTLAYVRSFTDVFIILISIGLSLRFQQLQKRLEAVKMKNMRSEFWSELRFHYICLKRLLRYINKEISPLILLSFGNNMFFICFQLFNSFRHIGHDFIAALSFWYSLIFAIIRTVLTIYMAASINDATNRILATLRDIPARSWCLELERFSAQISFDLTALSGNGFFFMTRQLILAMASTVVTYELMVTDVIKNGTINEKIDICNEF